jgi:hypothetical protein
VATLTVKGVFPLLVSVTLAGFTLQVALGGALGQLKLTIPAKPPLDAISMLYVAICPAVAICVVGEILERLNGAIPMPLKLMT